MLTESEPIKLLDVEQVNYVIEASKDGKVWRHSATFTKGQMSRFNVPFDDEIIIKEAESYLLTWSKLQCYYHVRVINDSDFKIIFNKSV